MSSNSLLQFTNVVLGSDNKFRTIKTNFTDTTSGSKSVIPNIKNMKDAFKHDPLKGKKHKINPALENGSESDDSFDSSDDDQYKKNLSRQKEKLTKLAEALNNLEFSKEGGPHVTMRTPDFFGLLGSEYINAEYDEISVKNKKLNFVLELLKKTAEKVLDDETFKSFDSIDSTIPLNLTYTKKKDVEDMMKKVVKLRDDLQTNYVRYQQYFRNYPSNPTIVAYGELLTTLSTWVQAFKSLDDIYGGHSELSNELKKKMEEVNLRRPMVSTTIGENQIEFSRSGIMSAGNVESVLKKNDHNLLRKNVIIVNNKISNLISVLEDCALHGKINFSIVMDSLNDVTRSLKVIDFSDFVGADNNLKNISLRLTNNVNTIEKIVKFVKDLYRKSSNASELSNLSSKIITKITNFINALRSNMEEIISFNSEVKSNKKTNREDGSSRSSSIYNSHRDRHRNYREIADSSLSKQHVTEYEHLRYILNMKQWDLKGVKNIPIDLADVLEESMQFMRDGLWILGCKQLGIQLTLSDSGTINTNVYTFEKLECVYRFLLPVCVYILAMIKQDIVINVKSSVIRYAYPRIYIINKVVDRSDLIKGLVTFASKEADHSDRCRVLISNISSLFSKIKNKKALEYLKSSYKALVQGMMNLKSETHSRFYLFFKTLIAESINLLMKAINDVKLKNCMVLLKWITGLNTFKEKFIEYLISDLIVSDAKEFLDGVKSIVKNQMGIDENEDENVNQLAVMITAAYTYIFSKTTHVNTDTSLFSLMPDTRVLDADYNDDRTRRTITGNYFDGRNYVDFSEMIEHIYPQTESCIDFSFLTEYRLLDSFFLNSSRLKEVYNEKKLKSNWVKSVEGIKLLYDDKPIVPSFHWELFKKHASKNDLNPFKLFSTEKGFKEIKYNETKKMIDQSFTSAIGVNNASQLNINFLCIKLGLRYLNTLPSVKTVIDSIMKFQSTTINKYNKDAYVKKLNDFVEYYDNAVPIITKDFHSRSMHLRIKLGEIIKRSGNDACYKDFKNSLKVNYYYLPRTHHYDDEDVNSNSIQHIQVSSSVRDDDNESQGSGNGSYNSSTLSVIDSDEESDVSGSDSPGDSDDDLHSLGGGDGDEDSSIFTVVQEDEGEPTLPIYDPNPDPVDPTPPSDKKKDKELLKQKKNDAKTLYESASKIINELLPKIKKQVSATVNLKQYLSQLTQYYKLVKESTNMKTCETNYNLLVTCVDEIKGYITKVKFDPDYDGEETPTLTDEEKAKYDEKYKRIRDKDKKILDKLDKYSDEYILKLNMFYDNYLDRFIEGYRGKINKEIKQEEFDYLGGKGDQLLTRGAKIDAIIEQRIEIRNSIHQRLSKNGKQAIMNIPLMYCDYFYYFLVYDNFFTDAKFQPVMPYSLAEFQDYSRMGYKITYPPEAQNHWVKFVNLVSGALSNYSFTLKKYPDLPLGWTEASLDPPRDRSQETIPPLGGPDPKDPTTNPINPLLNSSNSLLGLQNQFGGSPKDTPTIPPKNPLANSANSLSGLQNQFGDSPINPPTIPPTNPFSNPIQSSANSLTGMQNQFNSNPGDSNRIPTVPNPLPSVPSGTAVPIVQPPFSFGQPAGPFMPPGQPVGGQNQSSSGSFIGTLKGVGNYINPFKYFSNDKSQPLPEGSAHPVLGVYGGLPQTTPVISRSLFGDPPTIPKIGAFGQPQQPGNQFSSPLFGGSPSVQGLGQNASSLNNTDIDWNAHDPYLGILGNQRVQIEELDDENGVDNTSVPKPSPHSTLHDGKPILLPTSRPKDNNTSSATTPLTNRYDTGFDYNFD